MPVIKVLCLPADETEENLKKLCLFVITAVTSVRSLKLCKDDVTVLFPKDMMSDGLGEEVIVEIFGLFEKPERTQEVLQLLAERVGSNVKILYPDAKVECFVYPFKESQGFWTSK